MSKIAARFWVQSVKKTVVNTNALAREVILAPVVRPQNVDGADGNVEWSKYTPSGEIRLVITADATGQRFEDALGKDVAITMEIFD